MQIILVKIPMTPEGVEHFRAIDYASIEGFVKIPMTPEGVEHACLGAVRVSPPTK